MKTVPTLRLVSKPEAPAELDGLGVDDLPAEVRLALTDIAGAAREGLLAMSVAAGMAVMRAMFDAEITAVCGPRGKHDPDRAAGRHGAGRVAVVALAITADGTKVPVGLWEGSTENATVVKALLADLVARGLDATNGLLVVIDGAKALSAAVRAVFGASAAVQRCTVHKRRNVADHLPEAERGWVDTKLGRIFANPDPAAGLREAKALATALARKHPGAAASLREGLEDMFTVTRLGITGTLARTLTTSNPIESMISIARTTNRNVTHWRDGQMVLRWTAAGLLNAQRAFRRVKGYKQMPKLVAALHRHAHPNTAHRPETVSAAA